MQGALQKSQICQAISVDKVQPVKFTQTFFPALLHPKSRVGSFKACLACHVNELFSSYADVAHSGVT